MKKAEKSKKNPFRYFVYDFTVVTGVLPGIIAFRPKIWYEDEAARQKIRGGALLIANHIALSDPIMLMFGIWYRRHHFICLKSFFAHPASRWLFRQFQCIPVDRDNFGMATLRDIVDHLKAGHLVTMFPEGHITTTDREALNPFKSGMVLMSAMSRRPIIPVYIVPKKKKWQRQELVIGHPLNVAAEYGPMPSIPDMEKIAQALREQEERLANIPKERRRKK